MNSKLDEKLIEEKFENVELKDKLEIDCNTGLSMLELTMLIYDYGTRFTKIYKSPINNYKNLSEINYDILCKLTKNNPDSSIEKFIDKNNGLQCGIILNHSKKHIVIVFRGSDSIIDWLYNFLIFKTRIISSIYVHYGFNKQLSPVLDELLDTVNNLTEKYNDYSIYITGHSLGGALSTLFSYYLSKTTNKKINVWSFASPRVGNYNFKKMYNKIKNIEHNRVVNNRDTVTSIPYIGYYHIGTKIYLNKNNSKILKNYFDYDNILSFFNPFDHFLTRYFINFTNSFFV